MHCTALQLVEMAEGTISLENKYKHMYSHFPVGYEYALSIAQTKTYIWDEAHKRMKEKGGKLEEHIKTLMKEQEDEYGNFLIGNPPVHAIKLYKPVTEEWTQDVIDEMKLFLSMNLNLQYDTVTELASIRKGHSIGKTKRISGGFHFYSDDETEN